MIAYCCLCHQEYDLLADTLQHVDCPDTHTWAPCGICGRQLRIEPTGLILCGICDAPAWGPGMPRRGRGTA